MRAGDSVDRILAEWARQRPDLDFSPVGVITRLARVRTHIDAGLARVFTAHHLTAADFMVIVNLRRAGDLPAMSQSRLMTELGLTSGTISVRIDRLERAGIVIRTPDANDRRGMIIALTDRGIDLFDEIAPLHLANEDRLLSALTPTERNTLADLLRRLLFSYESTSSSGTGAADTPLGLRLDPAHTARERRTAVGLSDTPGLLVAEIATGSPAATAGFVRGDLITAANDQSTTSQRTLTQIITETPPDTSLTLSILRGDRQMKLQVRLAVQGPTQAEHLPAN